MNATQTKELLPLVNQLDADGAKELLLRVLGRINDIDCEVREALAGLQRVSVEFRFDSGALALITQISGGKPESKQWDYHTQVGSLLTFSLLQKAEGQKWPGLWVYAFSRSNDPGQLTKARTAVKAAVSDQCRPLALKINGVKTARGIGNNVAAPLGSFYSVTWSNCISVKTQAEEAALLTKMAINTFPKSRDYEKRFSLAVKAALECSLFFPAYRVCLDCVSACPDLIRSDAVKGLPQRLVSSARDMEEWLLILKRRLASRTIPESLASLVESHCIREVDTRLRKLTKLRAILCDESYGDSAAFRNPLNLFIADVREGDVGIPTAWYGWEDEDARKCRLQILREVRDILRDSTEIEKLEQRLGLEFPDDIVPDATIFDSIQLAAQNSDFLFPEPTAKSDHWIRSSATIIARLVLKYLDPNVSTSSRVSFNQIEGTISSDFNDDRTAKRLGHRRSDRR